MGAVLTDDEPNPAEAVRGDVATNFSKNVWALVDGQQRIVTVLLLLAALRDVATGSTKKDLMSLLVANDPEIPRVLAQEEDRPLVTKILTTDRPVLGEAELASKVGQTFTFFQSRVVGSDQSFWATPTNASKASAKIRPAKLKKVVLERLVLTDLQLDQAADQSAPAVFDAINGKRRELEPVDLLRNTVFAELEDIPFFTQTWAKLESESRHVKLPAARLGTLPLFIDSYLQSLGDGASQSQLATRLNTLLWKEAPRNHAASYRKKRIRAVVSELVTSFKEFKRAQPSSFGGDLVLSDSEATRSLDNINMLAVGPPLPLCLLFLRYRRAKLITEAQLVKALTALETYLGRRVVVGLGQQNMRSHLSTVTRKLVVEFGNASKVGSKPAKKGVAWSKLPTRVADLLATDAEPLPPDDDLRDAIRSRLDMNKLSASQKFAVLRRLNDELAGKVVTNVNPKRANTPKTTIYSIEHVFPDSFKDPSEITAGWAKQIASWNLSPEQIAKLVELRNSFGNYTLVHNNSALGRKPFLDPSSRTKGKRQIMLDRPLQINDSVTRKLTAAATVQNRWSAHEIIARGRYLADLAVKAYPA